MQNMRVSVFTIVVAYTLRCAAAVTPERVRSLDAVTPCLWRTCRLYTYEVLNACCRLNFGKFIYISRCLIFATSLFIPCICSVDANID
jgi:hypothetical protein